MTTPRVYVWPTLARDLRWKVAIEDIDGARVVVKYTATKAEAESLARSLRKVLREAGER